MYRRIHLSQAISVTITIDPLNPTACPLIEFLGSDNEVKKQKDDVSKNIHVRSMGNINYNSDLLICNLNIDISFYRTGIRNVVF